MAYDWTLQAPEALVDIPSSIYFYLGYSVLFSILPSEIRNNEKEGKYISASSFTANAREI